MKKIGICGIYGMGPDFSGGQPVKVRTVTEELIKEYGKKNVLIANTFRWKKNPLKLLFNCFLLFKNCENIIMLPAQNGIKVFSWIFLGLNILFGRKVHYIVIGGWLPDFLKEDKKLRKRVASFFGVYVETESMKIALESLGLNNIYIMNNFKKLKQAENILFNYSEPYKLCVFSRITENKGIEDAINAVMKINADLGREVYHLDLYGHLDKNYAKKFNSIMEKVPPYIKYNGVAEPEKSVEVIRNYFIQLFPTRFKTEGIPGSIIDSYFAGVPVLASKWNSFYDVIDEGKTGLGFEFANYDNFILKLKEIADKPSTIIEMKKHCIEKSIVYSPDYVMKEFVKHLK